MALLRRYRQTALTCAVRGKKIDVDEFAVCRTIDSTGTRQDPTCYILSGKRGTDISNANSSLAIIRIIVGCTHRKLC